jgi:hypothetical protein
MPKPIFIVGNQRSGTTWLANKLCQHSKITGVQEEPFGIRESQYFNVIEGYFGNLKNDNNFSQFIESFGSSDYFRLTGIDKEFFYKHRPKNYVQVFRLLMDSFATKESAEFWLEKSPGHSLFLNKISNYFKDAKFVGIKRNTVDIIKSAVRRRFVRNNLIKKLLIVRRVLQHYKYDKFIKKFNATSNNIMMISYEELRERTQEILINVLEFLGLEFEPSLLDEKYQPYTSFSNFNASEERASILTSLDKKLIKWASLIFKSFPYSFYRILFFFQLNTRKRILPPDYSKDFLRENNKTYR